MTKATSIAFIGAGNMAAALISGLVADGADPHSMVASDPDREKTAALAAATGVRVLQDNAQAVRESDTVVLAVKPQMLRDVANDIRDAVHASRPLVISIAAGIRSDTLREWLGEDTALVRTMPNTPAMIQAGATVLYATAGVSDAQREAAESVLRAVGLTQWVQDEGLVDAATALSGSGPAYFFLVMEAMAEAGRKLGLDEQTAHLLTLQTALGAARMAMESSEGPAVLRERVTSPGGTTEQALRSFANDDIRGMFERALTAARDRSVELSEVLGRS